MRTIKDYKQHEIMNEQYKISDFDYEYHFYGEDKHDMSDCDKDEVIIEILYEGGTFDGYCEVLDDILSNTPPEPAIQVMEGFYIIDEKNIDEVDIYLSAIF